MSQKKLINSNNINRQKLTPKRQLSEQENFGLFLNSKIKKDFFYKSILELEFINDIDK